MSLELISIFKKRLLSTSLWNRKRPRALDVWRHQREVIALVTHHTYNKEHNNNRDLIPRRKLSPGIRVKYKAHKPHQRYSLKTEEEDVPLVAFTFLVFTRMADDSYCRRDVSFRTYGHLPDQTSANERRRRSKNKKQKKRKEKTEERRKSEWYVHCPL